MRSACPTLLPPRAPRLDGLCEAFVDELLIEIPPLQGSPLLRHLHITIPPGLPLHFPLPSLPITILVNDDMQPRPRAGHAYVCDTSVPVVVNIREPRNDDDVVFEALEAGDGGPGDALQGGGA
jgi:hypothetical protein